jgi:hypothetical protein
VTLFCCFKCHKAVYTWEVGSSPKAQVVPRLEDEGHWKRGTFPKTRKLEMGCGSNFMCKLKKKGHGPLSRWAAFFKWSYPYGLYLDLPCSHWFSFSQHSLTSACTDFFYLCHFWAIFYVFWQKSPSFAPGFQKLLPQGGSKKYSPLGPGNHYSKLPPRIPHRHFIHWKKQGPKP